MGKKFVWGALSLLFVTGVFLAFHTDASAISCRDECYSSCCGDEGICNGDDEEACVSDCLKECDDGSVPVVTAPSDDSENADEAGNTSSDGDSEDH